MPVPSKNMPIYSWDTLEMVSKCPACEAFRLISQDPYGTEMPKSEAFD
jgi:hypothetical protein